MVVVWLVGCVGTVQFFKPGSEEHAYMETMIVDDSNGAVPLQAKEVRAVGK